MARGPRGAFLGDNNLKCIPLGSHGDATTEDMRKLRCRSWITSSLRVSAEELTWALMARYTDRGTHGPVYKRAGFPHKDPRLY